MKLWTVALVLYCCASLTGCHGVSTYAPPIGDSARASSTAATPKGCTAKAVNVPGKYVGMFAVGSVSGKNFTSLFGQWSLLAYKKAAAAHPSAAKPAPQPTPIPTYLYTGTYTMKKTKQQGCVLLVIGKAVQPNANDSASNGVVVAAPETKVKKFGITVKELGLLSMKLTGLSASGGRGTATLLTQDFKPYDTATIVLGKRTSTNSP